ncbi:ABC transporter ATP-binding protein [Dermabacteraceae bacterium TAE3-ERU5]|nr:ABC transporter ATP-binding protein [Dermabacteraceae bacterium TAE3-ERU5]
MENSFLLADVSKSFGGRNALDRVSVSGRIGEVFGLVGPSGSGKSLLIGVLLGEQAPDSGSATVLGSDCASLTEPDLGRVGVMSGPHAFSDLFTCRENLSFWCYLRGLSPSIEVDAALARVGLGTEADKPTGKLSAGMLARLEIARALIGSPELVILDEPTAHLDRDSAAAIRAIIESLAKEGKSVLLVSHDLAEVARVCDRVALLAHGRIAGVRDVPKADARERRATEDLRAATVQLEEWYEANLEESGNE